MRLSQFRKVFGKVLETKRLSNNGNSANGRGYSFDDFTVDPANRVLLRSGQIVPLTARVFDVLLVLVENPGRLLGKDELIESVWHDDFVEEGNLARNVSTLRKALDDNSKEHKYIVTVQGRGYRFVADVKEFDSERRNVNGKGRPAGKWGKHEEIFPPELPDSNSLKFRKSKLLPRNKYFWLLSTASVLLLGLAIAGLQAGASLIEAKKQPSAFENVQQIKLTHTGNVVAPAISADGRYLAYIAVQGSDKGLCLRQLATGSVLRLVPWRPETTHWGIEIAPDNSFVYYVGKDANTDHGSLYRVPLLGGTPHKLVERADGLSISPDGLQVALVRIDRQAGTESIIVVNNDGSDEKFIASVRLDSLYYSLHWSPDGQSLVYSLKQHEPEGDRWHIAEIPVSGGGPEKRIGEASSTLIASTRWLPDKSGLISNMIDETTRQPQLYYVAYPDGARRQITSDSDGSSGVSMTADGRTIVTGRSNLNRQIWTFSVVGEDAGIEIASGTGEHVEAVAWAGNDYLVYDKNEKGSHSNFNIWRMRPDGSEREQLTFDLHHNTQPAVSQNGQTIAFVSRRSGKRQVWRMGISGKDATQLTFLPNNVSEPRFSGDGNTICFIASVAGKNQVWQVPVAGGDASPVSEADVYNVWDVSPDGSKLAHIFFDDAAAKMQTRIHRLDVEVPDKIIDFRPESWMRWSSDGRSIYFNSAADDARNVWRHDLDGSPAKQMTNFRDNQIFSCASRPDGSQMACIRQAITFDAVMIRSGL